MANASRKGDLDSGTGQGRIERGASSVFINGIPAGLHVSPITPHSSGQPIIINEDGYSYYGSNNENEVTTDASPSVFIEGSQLLRIGSPTSSNHVIIEGSPDVFCQ